MGGTAVEFMGVLTWGLSIQVSVVAKDSAPSLTSRASPERTGEAATLLGETHILTAAFSTPCLVPKMRAMHKILFVLLAVCLPALADTSACTREYAPVCGEYKGERKTYPTRCVMKNAKAKWLSDGACPTPTNDNKKPAE
jgi:hypothetical protein